MWTEVMTFSSGGPLIPEPLGIQLHSVEIWLGL